MDVESLSRPEALSILRCTKILQKLSDEHLKTLMLILSTLSLGDDDFGDALDQMIHMSTAIKQK